MPHIAAVSHRASVLRMYVALRGAYSNIQLLDGFFSIACAQVVDTALPVYRICVLHYDPPEAFPQ